MAKSVLAIPGSLRVGSYNRALLRAAAEVAPAGLSITVYEDLASIPPFNADDEDPEPAGVARLRQALADSDGVLIATPEYNGSMPGTLKNVIDWISRHEPGFGGKPVATLGATSGQWGTRLAQAQLRHLLDYLGAHLMPKPVVYVRGARHLMGEHGDVADDETLERLRRLTDAFEEWLDRF